MLAELHNVLFFPHINLIDVGLQKKRLFQGQKLTILSLEKQNISKETLIRLLGAA